MKKFTIVMMILLLVTIFLLGCAGVKVYDKDNKDVGFSYYEPKIYLLVESITKGNDKQTTAKLMSIPDLSKPRTLRYKSGIGSVAFNFNINNGLLTNYGNTIDSKVPESISALGSLASGASGFVPTGFLAEIKPIKIEPIDEAVNILDTDVIEPLKNENQNPIKVIIDKIKENREKLYKLVLLDANKIPDNMNDFNKLIEKRRKDVSEIVKDLREYNVRLDNYKDNLHETDPLKKILADVTYKLKQVVIILSKFSIVPDSNCQLYEIVFNKKGIDFIPVELPRTSTRDNERSNGRNREANRAQAQ